MPIEIQFLEENIIVKQVAVMGFSNQERHGMHPLPLAKGRLATSAHPRHERAPSKMRTRSSQTRGQENKRPHGGSLSLPRL